MVKITTLLFDCDNTLVLSEALAFEACAQLANEILEAHGIPDRYTGPQLLNEFVGQNFRGMMTSLQRKYDFTMPEDEFSAYVSREEDAVIAKLEEKGQPCEGVMPVLERVGKQPQRYGLAVVSSSAHRRVVASVRKVGQDKWFPPDKIFSAATSLPKPTSKPDPAIYLFACETLGVKPAECVAIEDSKSGATSANRAGIETVGYVGSYETAEKRREMVGVLQGCGCRYVMEEWSEFEGLLKKIEAE